MASHAALCGSTFPRSSSFCNRGVTGARDPMAQGMGIWALGVIAEDLGMRAQTHLSLLVHRALWLHS